MEFGNSTLAFGTELEIDRRCHLIMVDGKQILLTLLTPMEFELLHYMAESLGQVFSNEQLYTHIWGDVPDLGMEKTVKVHLSNLRRKLADAGKTYIQNVRGVGCRFVSPREEQHKNM